jgi:hypothetical protein
MRLVALVPALVLGGALVAPPIAEADGRRRSDPERRYGYERSDRTGQRGRHYRSYRRGHPHHYRYHHRPRPYYRPHHRRYRRPYWGPRPPYRPYYFAPRGFPYAHPGPLYAPPPYRGGVHGSVSIGLPFVGFSLHF